MKVSVVIPARNEEVKIGAAVRALLRQEFPRSDFEIIVVDNGSTDNTSGAAKIAGADKVILEKEPGTNIARQRGVKESTGEIIGFLDADSEAPPEWLNKISRLLHEPGVVAVSGPYEMSLVGWKGYAEIIFAHKFLPMLDKILYFVFRKKAGVIIGGNFAAWRWAINQIGGLPPLKFWGDDAATAMKLSREVGRVLFTPEIEVKNSPRRYEKRGFLRLSFIYAWHYIKMFFTVK